MYPDPREDPKSRSLKGVPIKDPLVGTVPNWGIYFLDPPGGGESIEFRVSGHDS